MARSNLRNPTLPTIDDVIRDLQAAQDQLTGDLKREEDGVSRLELLKVHGLNAARLGSLLRTRHLLASADAGDQDTAIAEALDYLQSEQGWNV